MDDHPAEQKPVPSWQSHAINLVLRLNTVRHPSRCDVADFRRTAARVDRWFARRPPGIDIREGRLGAIPATRIRQAVGTPRGILFLIHGGGWCLHTPRLHTGLAGRLALALNVEAVLPRYRLAPEHPFPAAGDDCLAAWQALLETGINPADVILAGDSAGGALALGLLAALRERDAAMPACTLLLSAATDLTTIGRSVIDNERSDAMFGIPALFLFRHWYIGEHNPGDARISPYWGDFQDFPPLFFQASGSEMLLDNSRLAEVKARRQGVQTRLSVWPGMPHDFTLFPFLPEARSGIAEQAAFVRWVRAGQAGSLPENPAEKAPG